MSRAKQFLSCTNTSIPTTSGKKSVITTGLILPILIALVAGNVSYAAAAAPAQSMANREPVQTRNTHKKALKSAHTSRKEAAKRLRAVYQQGHQQQLQDWVKTHQGQGKQARKAQVQTGGAI
jgi:uncharacterized membrane protein